ncbi:MAG: cytochrome c, partial [Cyclobacteriaceae bacterium]|nr:cytochrome c [Cyclobacteriaceae bacterium]
MRTFLRIIFTFLAGYMVACQPSGTVGEIKEADHSIAKGQAAFTQNCSTCHNFKRDDIGPRLGGVTEQVTDEWIKTFIKNPQAVIESGDE